jgi:hypothetical protein
LNSMPESRESLSGDEELYQVDVIVAMFAIMLVLLLVSEAAVNNAPNDKSLHTYKPRDPETASFVLRSIQSPYIHRDIWLLRNDRLVRLDLPAISKKYLASTALNWEATINEDKYTKGSDIDFSAGSKPTAFRFKLTPFTDELPQSIVKETIPITTFAGNFDLEKFKSALIYVWYDQMHYLPGLRAMFDTKAIPHKFAILGKDNSAILLKRGTAEFALERVLRAY